MALIVLLIVLFVWQCGPEAMCYAKGGEPVGNLLGVEWCELDGNSRPSGGDFRLEW
ncbi:hypothetical protein [Candidatus Poriferisodalis sp.]|uniref:hypothetical protein n=1 Tax=Candidatus Poriferisodalis sp. TaxID=3101277 RepID=UPI003B02D87E